MKISSKQILEELFTQVICSRVLTRHQRYQIQQVILYASPLNDDEHAIINRLFYNIRRGWVKIVD
ncbi:MAG: hypothetical protein WBA93_23045 [Microcoleaceae cyanobacterium]